MREEKIKIYSFKELSKEAQQRAIDDWRNNNDMPELNDLLAEEAKMLLDQTTLNEKIPLRNFDNIDVSCSLGFLQSDFLTLTYIGEIEREDGSFFSFKVEGYGLQHQFRPDITIYSDEDGEEEEKMEEVIREHHEKLCHKVMEMGHNYILEENEDDNIAENITLNDYEFTEDGKLY